MRRLAHLSMPIRHLFRSDYGNSEGAARGPVAEASGTQSIGRAAALLRILAATRSRGAGLTELVERSHLHKPTCRRILVGLMDAGLVKQDPARDVISWARKRMSSAPSPRTATGFIAWPGMRRAACARDRRRGLRAGASRFVGRLPAAGGRRLPDSLVRARGRRPSSPWGRRRRPRAPRRTARRRGRGGTRG